MRKIIALLFIAFFASNTFAQSSTELRKKIEHLISNKKLTAGISIKRIEDKDTLSINGNLDAPMMSVFKFHIALTVLDLVDKGKLKLDQSFFIKKEELLPNTWSPMREEFPEGDVNLTLDQLLRYTVSHSDNNGCDILLRQIGGTETVQKFINSQGINDFTIKVNEEEMSTWENLYVNTTTPLATTTLLEKFYKGQVLKETSTKYLYQIMVETSRGLTWMKAGLPKNTELAHRTGISGTNDQNLRVAMNNIGIFKLPNGQHVILCIYLKNISISMKATEKLMADITKVVWKHYTSKN